MWAPNALSVSVVGDFNGWDAGNAPMVRVTKMGVWEYTLESGKSLDGGNYKYSVTSESGTHLKADPYAFWSETLKGTASKIYDPTQFRWSDSLWRARRMQTVAGKGSRSKRREFFSAPMHIYEMHLGSWRTRDGASTKDGAHYLSYREIADELSVYLTEMGYTHVELLPVMEHPFDGSWGYQVCGYYAPTSRLRHSRRTSSTSWTRMHSAGIGVILDLGSGALPEGSRTGSMSSTDGPLL